VALEHRKELQVAQQSLSNRKPRRDQDQARTGDDDRISRRCFRQPGTNATIAINKHANATIDETDSFGQKSSKPSVCRNAMTNGIAAHDSHSQTDATIRPNRASSETLCRCINLPAVARSQRLIV